MISDDTTRRPTESDLMVLEPQHFQQKHATEAYRSVGVNDGDLAASLDLSVLFPGLLGDEGPELVNVDDGAVVLVLVDVEVSHTDLECECKARGVAKLSVQNTIRVQHQQQTRPSNIAMRINEN